ncbi:response regulator FixJ [Phenylobacterium sp.]|uniref:response regulator FixJ n=1 Tax=Phenylobacterium sp. TaxID=1871053 RepID=UPI00272FAEA7|nr:response regulator FixJ [Phenylobacterium sp.]MDP1873348.1 response regulator FixJ [Phenylobacterium sp.]MDP3488877.1 response regulator FixJ [Phenylobacterium sp.]
MTESVVHVIDDDEAMRESLAFLLDTAGLVARTYDSAPRFLEALDAAPAGVIVTDIRMPEMSGLELVRRLKSRGCAYPVIMITGHGDVPLAVEAMKAGVVDFLEKPFEEDRLLAAIRTAQSPTIAEDPERERVRAVLDSLSPREHEVLEGVVEGKLNKVIAHELGISPRTVEVYRANVMSKTGARGLSELIRMVLLIRP